MNKLVQIIDDMVGHLQYYLEKSIGLWMLVFLIYLLITIINAELGG